MDTMNALDLDMS